MRILQLINRAYNRLEAFCLEHCPRLRFCAICRALGLEVRRWQRDYALGKKKMARTTKYRRCTGKTTAVLLKLLMQMPPKSADEITSILMDDADLEAEEMKFAFRVRYDIALSNCRRRRIPVFNALPIPTPQIYPKDMMQKLSPWRTRYLGLWARPDKAEPDDRSRIH